MSVMAATADPTLRLKILRNRARCPNCVAPGVDRARARFTGCKGAPTGPRSDLISRDLFSAAPLHLCSATSGGALSGDPKSVRAGFIQGQRHALWQFFSSSSRAIEIHIGSPRSVCIRRSIETVLTMDYYKNSSGPSAGKLPMKSRSRVSAPSTVKRTVPRGRLPNAEYRTREYLTEREVERLMKAAGNNRHGHRDATMISRPWPLARPSA
jgi:hypothetical protein